MTKKSLSMIKRIALAAAMLMQIVPAGVIQAKNSDVWDGTSDTSWFVSTETEYVLTTAEQFAGFAELVNSGETFQGKTVILDSDIILNSGMVENIDGVYSFVTDGEGIKEWNPIGVYESSSSRGFRGTFNGNNSVISGVYINSDEEYLGLFGISFGCEIRNLRIENSLYIADNSISTGGIIAGTPKTVAPNTEIKVDNCIVDAVITDNGSLQQNTVVGGIVGSGRATIASRNTKIDISNSCFKGIIDYTGDGFTSNGAGIIAESGRSGLISSCANDGNITANGSASGICDYSRDMTVISGCYNSGEISSENYAGGITGYTNASLKIEYCYNSGNISGTNGSGAIVAYNEKDGEYINNFYLSSSAPCGIKTASGEITDEDGAVSAVSEDELKSADVLGQLNGGSEVYVLPENGDNNGFPVIKSIYYAIMYGGKYSVSNLEITGTTGVGDLIRIEYVAEGEANALEKIKYEWYISDTENGEYKKFESDTDTVSIKAEYHKKYIKAVLVLPAGETMESEPVRVNIYTSDFDGVIDNIEVRGIFTSGNYLYFRYESESVKDEHIAEAKWFVATSANGSYKEAGKGLSIKTEDIAAVRFYKVTVTLINGEEYTSPAVEIKARDARQWAGYTAENFADYRVENDNAYKFTVDGHDFILLDFNPTSDTARFKVIATDTYGKCVYADMDGEAFTEQFPEIIVKHVDKNAFWNGSINAWGFYMHGGILMDDAGELDSYHGFYAPGLEDIINYKDILGLKAYNHNAYVIEGDTTPIMFGLTSNAAETINAGYTYAIGTDSDGNIVLGKDGNNDFGNEYGTVYEVRPMFYLSKDFFTEARLDTDSMGEKVIEILRNAYEKEEIAKAYNKRFAEKVFGYPCDYTITNEVCTDSGENVTVTATVEAYADSKNGTMIAAAYHEDGRILAVGMTEIAIGRGETCNAKIQLGRISIADAKNIKISIIGGTDGLVAVTKQIELIN